MLFIYDELYQLYFWREKQEFWTGTNVSILKQVVVAEHFQSKIT